MPGTSGVQRGIYVFHPAADSSGRVFYSYFDGQSWGQDTQVPATTTKRGLAAAYFKGRIHCFHCGEGNDYMYCNVFDGTSWSGDTVVPNTGMWFKPSAVVYNGAIYVFHHGQPNSGQLWYNVTDGEGNWQGDQPVPNTNLFYGPSAVVLDSQVLCFHQGFDSNNNDADGMLYVNRMDANGNWQGDQRVPNVGISEAPAAIVSRDTVQVSHQGSNNDQQLWYNVLLSSGWQGDQPVPNVSLVNGPGVCLFDNRLFCFHQKPNNDLALTTWLGYAWTTDVTIPDRSLWYSPEPVVVDD